eukprot:GHRR01001208.1.p1 GENE.GHRR01001208.1~~GHRR01001208.1.p1  ORF type:complete len:378 (+),score=75.19 GHRR01001208.1:1093-2226(+)
MASATIICALAILHICLVAGQNASCLAAQSSNGSKVTCCYPPTNVSTQATKAYLDACSGFGFDPSQDLVTNNTAAQQWRAQVELALLAGARYQTYLGNFSNSTVGGIPVVFAQPIKAMGANNTIGNSNATYNERMLLYLHGGGYYIGSCYSMLNTVAIVAQVTGTRVLCVEYRLAPENRFPAGLEDCYSVFKDLVQSQGYNPKNLAVVGDSAGGGMVLALLQLLQQRGLPQPAAAGLISPWIELSGPLDTYTTLGDYDPVLKYVANMDSRMSLIYVGPGNASKLQDPLVSPLYGTYNSSYPPTLIQVGLREVLLSESVQLYRKMKAGGQCVVISPWDGMFHVFQALAIDSPEAQAAQKEMGAFFAEHLGSNGTNCST